MENTMEINTNQEQMNQESKPSRMEIKIYKWACADCNLFNPNKTKVFSCKTSPQCTGRVKVLKKGVELETFADELMKEIKSDMKTSNLIKDFPLDVLRLLLVKTMREMGAQTTKE